VSDMVFDWTEYGKLYEAEKAAYAAYREEATGGKHGRVKPTKLRAAHDAWLTAFAARRKLETLVGLQLGVEPYEVTRLYLEYVVNPTEVKRG